MGGGYGGYPLPPPHQASFPLPHPPNPAGAQTQPPQGYYGPLPPTQYLSPQLASQTPDPDDAADVFSTFK